MSFSIDKTSYTFKPTESLKIGYKASDTVTYGYLYGLKTDAINSISSSNDCFVFYSFKEEGTYTCYIGAYVGTTWEQTGNFEIIIKKDTPVEPTPPPTEPTSDLESTQTAYDFTTDENVVITLNQACKGGYLYGDNVPNAPVSCTTDNSTSKIFGTLAAGDYTGCYVGSYINGKWVQTGNFTITVTESSTPTPTPDPTPNPEPTPDPKPDEPTGPTVDPIPLPTPTGNVKEDLQNIKSDYDSKYASLVSNYNKLLKLVTIGATDKANLKVYISDFQKSNAAIYTEFEKALDNINANRTNDLNKVVSTSITQLTQNMDGISTEVSTTNKKLGVVTESISTIQQKNNLLDVSIKNIGSQVSSMSVKLQPDSIINSVNSAFNSGSVLQGATTTLTKDSFTVSDSSGSKVVLQDGQINAYNAAGKKTYYMSDNAIGICAKDNSDALGIISSVYKATGSYNDKGNNTCWTDPTNRPFKGVGYLGGDYAGFITMGIDDSWGVDNGYREFFRGHKGGWLHMGTDINFHYEFDIANIGNINRNEVTATYFNKVVIEKNTINTNSTSDKNLWLNWGCGWDALQNKVVGTTTRVGNGFGKGDHGSLVCGSLYVHGQKNRIVDCGDLGFIAMSAYETATPYFGDLGSAKTDETGVCYVMFEREQMEVSNTNINYNVQVTVQSLDLNAKVQIAEKKPQMVKFIGTPNTEFDYELKFVQKGYENVRFERVAEKRSLKTDFSINDEAKKNTSSYKNRIDKDSSLQADMQVNRQFNLAKLNELTNINRNNQVLNTLDEINYINERRNENGKL